METQKNVYDITFVGQDYQPIQDAAERITITREGKEYYITEQGELALRESRQISNPECCRYILDTMLERIAPDGRCKTIKNSSHKLFDANFRTTDQQGYFGGIVGVVKQQIVIPLKQEDDAEEYTFHITLQIKSRLDVDAQGEPGKPYFLANMLLRDKVDLNDNNVPNSEDEIFDYLLLFWFKEQLQRACLKGYYKTYRRFEKNDDRVKGTIDISRHIKLNMGQRNGKIAYSYRENTIDNFLNHLIVAAYKHLKNKYYELVSDNFDNNIELKRMIDYLSNEICFSPQSSNQLINKNIKMISHPYFTEYEQLRITCLKILRDEGISIFDGDSDQETQGILFYLPDLWERFLEDEVLCKCMADKIHFESQKLIKNFGYEDSDAERKNYIYKQETYPDYVFFSDKCPFMILDAKCKPKWEGVFKQKSVKYVMEDYNKCIRDMVAIDAKATGVIFPTNNESDIDESIYKHPISGYNGNALFYTVPIKVPRVNEKDSFTCWKRKFKDDLCKRIEVIKSILLSEKNYAEEIFELKERMKRF